MDAREIEEELASTILQLAITGTPKREIAHAVIKLPELEAYFREKFENEPGKLVAEKECNGVVLPSAHDNKNCPCHGTGIIKRRMTRKEVEEWAHTVINGVMFTGTSDEKRLFLTLKTGERVSVGEK